MANPAGTHRIVMAGLVPAIHDLFATADRGARSAGEHGTMRKKDGVGRHKAGHDDGRSGKAA
jgi:hypothetical protein